MGHNSVVSGYLKSIGISRVDGLSNGTLRFYGVTAYVNDYLESSGMGIH